MPVSASATVVAAEAIQLTGLSASFSFPTATAGTTTTTTAGAETYVVSVTGAGTGYTLTVTPSAASLSDGASHSIPDADLSVMDHITGSFNENSSWTFTGGAAESVDDTNTNPVSDTHTETWSLAVPALQFPATYTIGLTYLAMANS
jgi:hypothetical protein